MFRAPESINQDCLICLGNARAAMEALNEVEEALKKIPMDMNARTFVYERLKNSWYALHLRKSVCHGHHEQEISIHRIKIVRSTP
jgi:hypothetical protein